jgi:sialate O-acetylesterase
MLHFPSKLCVLLLVLSFGVSMPAESASATPHSPMRPVKPPAALKVHGIFRSHMVLQRDKPITIWGWAPVGTEVTVALGDQKGMSKAAGESGRWEVVFAAQPANAQGQLLVIQAGEQTVRMEDILIGDIWVMNGQSNMAFALKGVFEADLESATAHLPLLRHLRIQAGAESEYVETDIKDEFLNGENPDKNWKVATPEVALEMGAIGYVFGSQLQRALQIPIGIIDNARGGASLESLVPRHKFDDHPDALAYLKWVDERRAAFSEEAFLADQMRKYEEGLKQYEKQLAEDKAKGREANRRKPNKPDGSIRTWSVPGRSPSDAAACYNGMFGVFKGLNIKGVAFHQGFNNSMMNTSCNPKFYRLLLKLMVEGWREDFNDLHLPVTVIGLCAGGEAQTALNFEMEGLSTASYIREAQRLGLADVQDPQHTGYIPSDDQRIPQLHPQKKKELGLRAARWALKTVYGMNNITWDTANLVSAEPVGQTMVLTFDRPVFPDDKSAMIEGFSLADRSGIYFMASGAIPQTKDKMLANRQIVVASPLVTEPVSVRYSWARGPMGNLKVDGKPWQPLHSFRTDNFDFTAEVSHMDPEGPQKNSEELKKLKDAAAAALKKRLETTPVYSPALGSQ